MSNKKKKVFNLTNSEAVIYWTSPSGYREYFGGPVLIVRLYWTSYWCRASSGAVAECASQQSPTGSPQMKLLKYCFFVNVSEKN